MCVYGFYMLVIFMYVFVCLCMVLCDVCMCSVCTLCARVYYIVRCVYVVV